MAGRIATLQCDRSVLTVTFFLFFFLQTSKQSALIGMRVIGNEGVAAVRCTGLCFQSSNTALAVDERLHCFLAETCRSVTFATHQLTRSVLADWTTRYYFATVAENVLFKRGDKAYKVWLLARARLLCALIMCTVVDTRGGVGVADRWCCQWFRHVARGCHGK